MKVLQAFIVLVMVSLLVGSSAGNTTSPTKYSIESKRFAYEPSVVRVKKGQPVTLILHTEDVTHGLTIKELGIKTEVKKGSATEVTFTPDRAGDYVAKCSHFCGIGHGSMTLTIRVTE